MLRWLLRAPDGPDIEKAIAGASRVYTSVLTLAEAGRSLRRLVATGALAAASGDAANALLGAVSARWNLHVITEPVLARVTDRFPVEPVRTLDAIHLATAALLAAELGPLAVLSADDRIRRNARAMGLAVAPGGA